MASNKKSKKREGKPGQVNFRTFTELTDDFDMAMDKLDEWDIRGIDGRSQSKAAVAVSLICHLIETVRAGEGPTRELEDMLKASHLAWVGRLGRRPKAASSVPPGGVEPQPVAVPDGPAVGVKDADRANKPTLDRNRPKRRA